MERSDPSKFFHGTPVEIHASERPFLDPRLAEGRDEGDPEVGHVFVTPDLLIASIFAFKDSSCRSIFKTEGGPIVVFDGPPPSRDAQGYVYGVEPTGFQETTRRGQPSGKWAMVEQNMPRVTDADGSEVAGIPVDKPVRKVSIRDLIEQDRLRICRLTEGVDAATFTAAVRDAIHLKRETSFVREALERGWLEDITSQFVDDPANPH